MNAAQKIQRQTAAQMPDYWSALMFPEAEEEQGRGGWEENMDADPMYDHSEEI